MRASPLLIAFAFVSIPLFVLGQSSPQATPIKGHLMGESLAEFLARSGRPDFLDQCRAVGGDKKQAKKIGLDVKTCETYLAAEQGALSIYATDPAWIPEQNPPSYEGKIASIKTSATEILRHCEVEDMEKASFAGGRLVEVRLGFPYSMEEMLPDLSAKYGSPTGLTKNVAQNSYGASWNVWRATWTMPDGTTVSAFETVVFDKLLSYFRWTDIVFTSKELSAQRAQAEREKPNPLDR